MDYNENDTDTDSDEEEDNEGESSGSDEDESDGEGDDSDYESVEEVIETVPGEDGENAEGLQAFSSDDDPERECCPICLNKFMGQDLGSPESCDHTFCLECIKEWSKNINTCPIDRTEFHCIHVKANPGGAVLKKVEVKVAPKEPEDDLEEMQTHCEICRSGDREDRLLLCDGCDLAYHCECLDPPLFHIPIEEWFCPSCSGVFDNRAVAGPSRSGTRRIIPRTRASEAVRSRVQNLQTIRTPRSSSTSLPRKTTRKSAPKKRKRRAYRKVIRRVVQLARTKKDMNGGAKGKLGARSSTVIVTYRRRKRRRKAKRKVSKRAVASSKTIPSSKQRIARQIGITKGSIGPQIKKSTGTGSRSTGSVARLPSHSLFGNKHQLMDFSENFNEDIRDASSVSSSKSSKGSSIEACPSTSSGLSILDSIMAGQKILHAKPDKVLIKTDGSLILKDDIKKQNTVRKIEKDSSHTPMSIALAKQGVRASLLDKNQSTSYKKHADATKTKNVSVKEVQKSFVNKVPPKSSSKLFNALSNGIKKSENERKTPVSTIKNSLGVKTKAVISSDVDDSFSDGFTSDTSYRETAITNKNELNHASKIKNKNCNNSDKMYHTKFDSLSYNSKLSSTTKSSKASTQSLIKKEIFSDEEIDNEFVSTNVKKIHIKQEITSDEETNIDSYNKPYDNKEQEFNKILTKIKKEPIDSDLKAIKSYENSEMNRNILSGNDLCDFNASQSIIDFVDYDVFSASQNNKSDKNPKLLKVKEEIPSDTEDYSQSLLFDGTSDKLDRVSESKKLLSIKKEPLDSDDAKNSEKENVRHNKRTNFIERLESTSTTFSPKSRHNLSENELPLPCTQAVASLSADDDLPCTQALSQVVFTDSEDDVPCTQALSTDSEDDMPCTQALSPSVSTDSEDDLPCTQAVPHIPANDSEDDEIPCGQASSQVPTSDSEDEEIPCNQASSQAPTSDSEDDVVSHAQTIPCIAADSDENNQSKTKNSEDDDDMPCTQVALIPSKSNKNSLFSFDNESTCRKDQLSSSEMDFIFKKPVVSTKKVSSNESNNATCKNSSTLSEFELPPTQAVTFSPVNKKEKSANLIPNKLKSARTSDAEHHLALEDDFSLPLTQVSASGRKQINNLSDIADMNTNLEINSPHATSVCSKNNSSSPNDSFDLPPTQILDTMTHEINKSFNGKKLSDLLNNDNDDEQSTLPDTQFLPDTQIIQPNSKNVEIGNTNQDQGNTLDSGKLKEIMSNIKQLVNSLSTNVHENQNLQNNSNEISNSKLAPNISSTAVITDLNETVSSRNLPPIEKNMSSNNCSNMLPEGSEKLSAFSTVKDNQNNIQSSDHSDNEEFCLEKLKESLKKTSDPVTPKKPAIHKHLPQVIATVPVKENVKIKPSNRRTFSFEEVMKLRGPNIEQMPAKEFSKFETSDNKILENCNSYSDDVDDSLPATQAVETINNKEFKSSLLESRNRNLVAKNHNTNEKLARNNLNKKNEFRTCIAATQDDDFPATHNMVPKVGKKSSSSEIDNSKSLDSNCFSSQNTKCKLSDDEDIGLPNTQIHFVKEKNVSSHSKAVKKELPQRNEVLSSHNNKIRTEKDLSINKSKRKLVDTKLDLKKNTDFMNFDDLPATQICNLTSINSNRGQRYPNTNNKVASTEVYQNNELENTYFKNDFISKRKNSSGEMNKKKKICHQIADEFRSKKNDSNEKKQNKGLKIDEFKTEMKNCVQNYFSTDCQLQNMTSDEKLKTNEMYSLKKIKVKQEKDDFEFVKPLVNVQSFNSTTSVSFIDLNLIKKEKVDPCEDSLPPTQAVSFNPLEDDSLPSTQINLIDANHSINKQNYSKSRQNDFLSAFQVKKEPCSDDDDDDVSVIELKAATNEKVKEVIIIDDEVNDFNSNSNLLNIHCKQEEKTSEIIDVSCIKKEKCSKAGTLLESESNINTTSKNNEISISKCSKDYEEGDGDSAKSKCDSQNHMHVKPIKNKRKSEEYDASKVGLKSSEDLCSANEKRVKNSFNQHKSKEKSKKNLNGHVSKETTSIISKKSLSKKEVTNLKEFDIFQEKCENLKSDHLAKKKSSKVSKKEIKSPQKSHEKGRNELIKHSSSKEEVKEKLIDSVVSNEIKNKTNKNNMVDSTSKSKEKIDKCGSFSKNINSIPKHLEKSKDSSIRKDISKSTNDQCSKKVAVTDKIEKDKQKHSEKQNNKLSKEIALERKSDKDRECSSEKENRTKNNKEDIVKIKCVNKRSYTDIPDKYNKKRKLDNPLDSDSSSNEKFTMQLSDLQNDLYEYCDLNGFMQLECDDISNKLSDSNDDGNSLGKTYELDPKPVQVADIKKVHSKHDLKEEIANEVKLALKPFYNTGLISKEDYKDIMRRAVPKIFMNCHNSVNPQKIHKLVLEYVSLKNNKS